jgi:predicted acylesterase/phospholipase RssA|tara:strand:+ start:965 stop:1867 length:903 start_codon:yes stop_codon:yes gene_type:complete
MIKHIVINGGGPTGIMCYGALKCLFENKFLQIENIQSVYGTSAGAIIAALILLKYDWATLDDYLLKRPWNKVFKLEPDHFFEMYTSKGLFQFDLVKEFLKPLLTAKDLTEEVTLKEFYEFNGIDFHCFTVEMNSFQKIDLSHTSHPDLPLLKALNMSSAVPILFKPIIDEDKCYVDGSLLDNYPINECISSQKCQPDEILGIKNKWASDEETMINNDMNILQYLQSSLGQLVNHIQLAHNSTLTPIRYELKCLCNKNMGDYTKWFEYMTNREKAKELIDEGKLYAELFMNYEKELGQCTV